VPRIIDQAIQDSALDLVVDDASHLLAPSTATFEMLFPRLRPGGLFLLEDWSEAHLAERGLSRAIDKEVDGKFAKQVAESIAAKSYQSIGQINGLLRLNFLTDAPN
jgi:hypothetical protein